MVATLPIIQESRELNQVLVPGLVRTLSLINSLEVNEQILYARMLNIEQSTLNE